MRNSIPPGFSSAFLSPFSMTVRWTTSKLDLMSLPSGVVSRNLSSLWHQPHHDAWKMTRILFPLRLPIEAAWAMTSSAGMTFAGGVWVVF